MVNEIVCDYNQGCTKTCKLRVTNALPKVPFPGLSAKERFEFRETFPLDEKHWKNRITLVVCETVLSDKSNPYMLDIGAEARFFLRVSMNLPPLIR